MTKRRTKARAKPPSRSKAREPQPGLSRAEIVYLVLSGLSVAVSIVKAPLFPISDPALFAFFGRAMLHGQRLYVDLHDNKLPSIYLVNLVWQALFDGQYVLHNVVEGLINAGSIALFALLLRRMNVASWALGTFLFAFFFTIPYPQFGFTQHYGIFFVVLALYLNARGAALAGGITLAVAVSFWIPGVLIAPAALQVTERRQRIAFLAGFLGLIALGSAAALAVIGPRFAHVIAGWPGYARGIFRLNVPQLGAIFTHSAVLPALGTMALLLAVVVRRPIPPAARFAFVWLACAFVAGFIPPSFAEYYFLPTIPPLAMAIAAFEPRLRDIVRHPLTSLAALALFGITLRQTVYNTTAVRVNSAYVQHLGEWIRASYGSGAEVFTASYFPEIQLAADSRNIGRLWSRGEPAPNVIIADPRGLPQLLRLPRPIKWKFGDADFVYVPVCPNLTGPILIYALRSNADAFNCRTLSL